MSDLLTVPKMPREPKRLVVEMDHSRAGFLRARGEVMSEEDVQSVLVDLMICANSNVFVGTGSSAVFRFISNVHRDDSQCLDVGW